MIKTYIRTAFRYFFKNKLTAFINILGLSIGICASLVIFMIVKYDYSFDRFEQGSERIYRVISDDDKWKSAGVPVPFAEALKHNVVGVEAIAPIFGYDDLNTKITIPEGEKKIDKVFKKQSGIVFTDAGYFKIIPHTWLAGHAASALNNNNDLVLTESRAKTYFPGVPADQLIGKMVIFNDSVKTTITGIVADLKFNTDFESQCFISINTVYHSSLKKDFQVDDWGSTNSANQILVKLAPHVLAATVNNQIHTIFKFNLHEKSSAKDLHRLQPLANVHTNPDFDGKVDPAIVKNLSILAVFLLLLGAINFINLSTAHASERAKEIGIRKTLGSGKGQLIAQFLSETFLLTFMATIFSIVLLPLILKVFSGFIPDGLDASFVLKEPVVWLFLFGITLFISLAAGIYPALILSSFRPVSVLKNTSVGSSGNTRSGWLRKSLIVSQFIIAQVFVIGVLVVDKQLNFAESKDMGFRKDAIINFYVPFDFHNPNNKKFVLKQELGTIPGVAAVSLGNQPPALSGFMSTTVTYRENKKNITLDVASRDGDTAFISVYKIPLISGRNITASDTANELLINETLARQIGFNHPQDAVNHTLVFGNGSLPIVGVMKDFNQSSVRSAVAPLIYYSAPKHGYVMHVALQKDPATWAKTIQQITADWKSVYPDIDLDYTFLDKQVEEFYKEDRQLSLLLTWAAGVAILISCLGMLGLVIFMTNRRVKEIGVRKVLGASIAQIVALLAGDFARLLLAAFAIAVPIAWWQTHKWLQNFAYHTELSWWIFLAGGVFMITIALLIISIRAGRAALANPVKSLRAE